jgi:hypothetical protein
MIKVRPVSRDPKRSATILFRLNYPAFLLILLLHEAIHHVLYFIAEDLCTADNLARHIYRHI